MGSFWNFEDQISNSRPHYGIWNFFFNVVYLLPEYLKFTGNKPFSSCVITRKSYSYEIHLLQYPAFNVYVMQQSG